MVKFYLWFALVVSVGLVTTSVSAMVCSGPHPSVKGIAGVCMDGNFLNWNADDCSRACECNDGKLHCKPPSDCGPVHDVEQACAVGPNYSWICDCSVYNLDTNRQNTLRSAVQAFKTPSSESAINKGWPKERSALRRVTGLSPESELEPRSILVEIAPEVKKKLTPSSKSTSTIIHNYLPQVELNVPEIDTTAADRANNISNNSADTVEKRQCNTDSDGCSACTECCVLKFNTAGCHEPPIRTLVTHDDGRCVSMPYGLGMYTFTMTECTGAFELCYLYNRPDCQNQMEARVVRNVAGQCIDFRPNFWIVSVKCFGDGPAV